MEIFLGISKLLEWSDLASFSITCNSIRTLIMPMLLDIIHVSNQDPHAEALLPTLEEFGHVVKRLDIGCFMYIIVSTENLGYYLCDEQPLAPGVLKLLSGHGMPNIEAISFNHDLLSECFLHRPTNLLMTKPKVLRSKMYEAIAQNTAVTELSLHNLLPVHCRALEKESFRQFLSQLWSLSVSFYFKALNGETPGRYRRFVSRMSRTFFPCLKSVVNLEVGLPLGMMLGSFGHQPLPLPLEEESMPLLRSLSLKNCVVDANLTKFVIQHSATIMRIHFRDSVGYTQSSNAEEAFDEGTWARFFDDICRQRPPHLTSVRITLEDLHNITPEWVMARIYCPPEDFSRELELLHLYFEESNDLMIFPYGSNSLGDAEFIVSGLATFRMNEHGEDLRAYCRLLGLMREAAGRTREQDSRYLQEAWGVIEPDCPMRQHEIATE